MDLISQNNRQEPSQAPLGPRLLRVNVGLSVFQIVGCDHELGSAAKEDNCGVCGGAGATCRLVRGHYKSPQDSGRSKNPGRVLGRRGWLWRDGALCLLRSGEDTVVVVPYRSRHVRLVLKGPDHLCKSW